MPIYNRDERVAPTSTAPQVVSPTGKPTGPLPAAITGVTFSPDSPTKISPLPSPKITTPQNGSRIPEFSSSDDDIIPPYKPTVRLPSPEKSNPTKFIAPTNSTGGAMERQQSETKIEVQKEDESQIENETSIIESKNVQSTKSESHSKRTLTTRNQYQSLEIRQPEIYEDCMPFRIPTNGSPLTVRLRDETRLLGTDRNIRQIAHISLFL